MMHSSKLPKFLSFVQPYLHLLFENFNQLVPMCFCAIMWSTFAFLYLLLKPTMPTFQYNNHLVLDILIANWKKYILKTHIQSFFYGIQASIGCHRMSSMAGLNFKAYPRSVVNQVHLPPPMGLPKGLKCTIGLTSLPWSSAISIPSLFMTLSIAQRLTLCFVCLEH